MKILKCSILISFIIIITIFNFGCTSNEISKDTNKTDLEVLLDASDEIEKKFQYLDKHSNNLLCEYKALDKEYSSIDISKNATRTKEIQIRQSEIKDEIKNIINEINGLKKQQIELKKIIEKYLDDQSL